MTMEASSATRYSICGLPSAYTARTGLCGFSLEISVHERTCSTEDWVSRKISSTEASCACPVCTGVGSVVSSLGAPHLGRAGKSDSSHFCEDCLHWKGDPTDEERARDHMAGCSEAACLAGAEATKIGRAS